jgi:glycosyltransferase involved in cell wall biosynthesis
VRKNVLFITRWYPNRVDKLDGNFIENHARAASMFCNIAVLYIGADSKMSNRLYDSQVAKEFGFTVIRIWYRNNDVSAKGFGRVIKFFRYIKATQMGWQLIKKNFGMPDVSHVHIFTRPALLAFYLQYKYRIPFMITEHSSHFVHDLPVLLPPLKWFAQFAARQACCITAVSKTLQTAMLNFGLRGNYTIVPNVVFVQESLEKTIINDEAIIIIAIGGLTDHRKNINGLIDAFIRIHHLIPAAQLNIVRPASNELHSKALISGLLNKRIFFHDYLSNEEVYKLLLRSSFLIVNSLSETFSMAAAEALACGKPVISTRCGGPEEFIDESSGILIDINDEIQLQEAIIKMCKEFKLYDPEKLQKYAQDHFSVEIVGKKLMGIYEEVLLKPTR